MRKKFIRLFSFFLPLCVTLLFLFWKLNPLLSGYLYKKQEPSKKPIIKTIVVHKITQEDTIPIYGTFEPSETMEITPKYPGVIEKLYVEEGDSVKKGQTLLKIDTTLLRLEAEKQKYQIDLISAQLQVQKEKLKKARKTIENKFLEYKKMKNIEQKSNLDMEKSKSQLSQKKELLREGIISGEDYHLTSYENKLKEIQLRNSELDVEISSLLLGGAKTNGSLTERILEESTSSEQAEVAASESGLRLAEKQLSLLNNQLESATLLSPIQGRVIKLKKMGGEYVSNTSGSILSLGVVSPISPVFLLGEKDSFSIHKGMILKLQTDLHSAREWKGVIRSILPLYQEKTFSNRIKAEIDNSDLALNPGVFFRGNILLSKKSSKMILPLSVVYAGESVYVYAKGKIESRKIKYYNLEDGKIEVQTGLQDKEEVVISEKESLRDGMEVEVQAR